MEYQQAITTQEEALTHLFFHCCFADDEVNDAEIKAISDKLVMVALHNDVQVKDEVVKYRTYRPLISAEKEYLQHLLQLIRPVNELALFSYCAELCLGDGFLNPAEESLLQQLAGLLQIEAYDTIIQLMVQRHVVETGKLF